MQAHRKKEREERLYIIYGSEYIFITLQYSIESKWIICQGQRLRFATTRLVIAVLFYRGKRLSNWTSRIVIA